MGIKEEVTARRDASRKAQNTFGLKINTQLLEAIQSAELAGKTRVDVTDKEIPAIFKREVNARRKAADQMRPVSPEHAEALDREIAYIEEFLPAVASNEDVESEIKSLIDSGLGNIGQIMGALSKKFPDFDKSFASKTAKGLL